MKKTLILTLLFLSSVAAACESQKFAVFYLPLEANFYVPPTRDYIMEHGIKVELNRCVLKNFFEILSEKEGSKSKPENLKALRILIINKKTNKEVFITSDKKILSNGKEFNIEKEILNDVLDEIMKSAR